MTDEAHFLAIVESDKPTGNEGGFCGALQASGSKAAEMDGGKGDKTRLGKQQPSRKRKLKRTENGGQDELQES